LDVDEFLELEKQIYLDMFPHNKDIFDDQEEDDTEVDITPKPKENKNVFKKGYGKKKRRLEEVEIKKDDSDDNTSDYEGYSD
jgi:hypothetical protein